ncbi:MAG: transporter substrate-binding domain-containing protein [Spirochaetaceae bacterium]|nr:transporter substrate-binding domain-containing protein [Spirochaetaceae bacterium]
MNKFIGILAVVALLLFAGCSGKAGGTKKMFSSLADFNGAKIASLSGAVFADYIDPVIPNVSHVYYYTMPDMAHALSSDKVDAVALDMPVALYLAAQNSKFIVYPDVVADDSYAFAVTKGSDLGVKANEVLKKMWENGTIAQLEKIWFSADESKKILPVLNHKPDFNGRAGTIIYGCETTYVPSTYIGPDGKPTGYELDIVTRIAYELNMKVEFVPMAFAGLLSALASGKVNMVGGCMSITEERKKAVDFVGPNFVGGITLVINKDRLAK